MNYLKRAIKSALRRCLGLELTRVQNDAASLPPAGSTDHGVWTPEEGSLRKREYPTYEEYAEHQISKLSTLDLRSYDVEYRKALRDRLSKLDLLQRGDTVLCIAARIGTECKAFIDLGCFAVGIDLNPGPCNHYVLHGDFHRLQFSDQSVDYVFTNALDHAFDLEKVLAEIKRVLKPGGVFIAEIVGGSADDFGREPGAFESLWWLKIDDVVERIARTGFRVDRRQRFAFPWEGEQVILVSGS